MILTRTLARFVSDAEYDEKKKEKEVDDILKEMELLREK